jgi:glycosyltransferase involved in cell wall biosynthesis
MNEQKNILFSIITVCYNSEKTIERTIRSVLNQTSSNFEYIIVDGNSTDKTLEIIELYKEKFTEKAITYNWISEPDRGIYNAFNKGVKLSNGNWVSFLGSDDYYIDDALELYSKTILSLKNNVDFVYSNVNILNNHDKIINKVNGIWSWTKFKRYMNIAHVGAFHNKEYFNKYGYFNEAYKIAGDYELLLRAKSILKTVKIEQVTVKMADGGVSNKYVNLAFKETLTAKNKTGKVSFLVCLLDYSIAMLKFQTKKIFHAFIR